MGLPESGGSSELQRMILLIGRRSSGGRVLPRAFASWVRKNGKRSRPKVSRPGEWTLGIKNR